MTVMLQFRDVETLDTGIWKGKARPEFLGKLARGAFVRGRRSIALVRSPRVSGDIMEVEPGGLQVLVVGSEDVVLFVNAGDASLTREGEKTQAEELWRLLAGAFAPGEMFSSSDVYAFESRFRTLYPKNDNIRPMLRAKLQELRDRGAVEFVSRGRYRLLERPAEAEGRGTVPSEEARLRKRPAEVEAALTELRAGLEELYGERLRGVYLYGSYARGDARPGSDLDVLVVLNRVDRYGEEIDRTGTLASRISLAHGVSVSRVFVDEAAFRAGETPFLASVRHEAIPA